jgi:hypothetical protein
MIISLPIYSIHGSPGIDSYLDASTKYLSGDSRSLPSSLFPSIGDHCPVCHLKGCAQWKGYYRRKAYLAERSFEGKMAIRYGQCTRAKVVFSFLPDFLIPWRKIGRTTLTSIARLWQEHRTVGRVIDNIGATSISRLPRSTVYENLDGLAKILRMNNVPTNDCQPVKGALGFLASHTFAYWDWFWSKIRTCSLPIPRFRSPRKMRLRWIKFDPDRFGNHHGNWPQEAINWQSAADRHAQNNGPCLQLERFGTNYR